MRPRHEASMRRLQDNYAKLPPEKQRAMGYGTITKAAGANAAPTPKMVSKPKPISARSQASAEDSGRIQERLAAEKSEGLDRGRGLAGLRKRMR